MAFNDLQFGHRHTGGYGEIFQQVIKFGFFLAGDRMGVGELAHHFGVKEVGDDKPTRHDEQHNPEIVPHDVVSQTDGAAWRMHSHIASAPGDIAVNDIIVRMDAAAVIDIARAKGDQPKHADNQDGIEGQQRDGFQVVVPDMGLQSGDCNGH